MVLFKRENGPLIRNAKYPDSPFLSWVGIFLVFLIETLANAGLFASVSDWGLVGGAGYASLMSAPNILGGLFLGWFGIRGAFHVRFLWNAVSVLIALALTAVVLFWNFYVGHFRVLLHTSSGADFSDFNAVLPQLLTKPYAFLGVTDALLLMIVGLLAAGYAISKGVDGFSDRYPGYAKIDKIYRAAKKAYEKSQTDYRQGVTRIIGSAVATIKKRTLGIERALVRRLNTIRRTVVALRRLENALKAIGNACRTAINSYRHENTRSRTVRQPTYFRNAPTFDDNITGTRGFDAKSLREGYQTEAAALQGEADKKVDELQQLAEKRTKEIPDLIRTAEVEADRRRADDAEADARGPGAQDSARYSGDTKVDVLQPSESTSS